MDTVKCNKCGKIYMYKECNPELRDNEWIRAEALEKAKNERKGYIEIGGRQGGKALSNYEPLITDNGTNSIGEAKIGDKIYDSDGKLCTITNVFPQGIGPVYRMYLAELVVDIPCRNVDVVCYSECGLASD